MTLLRPSLFDGRSLLGFFLLLAFIASYTLLIEYHQYTKLTEFDDTYVEATLLQVYPKVREGKSYEVLKTRLDNGAVMYTSATPKYKESVGKRIFLHVWVKASFLEYLRGFYAYSKVKKVFEQETSKSLTNARIKMQHENVWMQEVYGALFLAEGMSKELRQRLSALGISHLLAISGFHLGVLSLLIIGILYLPYLYLQTRYFPYRNCHRDLFMMSVVVLFGYLWFLGSVASLLRAFVMLLIGYFLHDRGLKIISMQTLLVSVLVILALFPKLIFSLGLWLSVSGVYFIFIFLNYFSHLRKVWQIVLLPIWVYVMMLPLSLYIFETFSLYHPLSILWSFLFTLYYPLSAFMHLLGFGNYADVYILELLERVTSVRIESVSLDVLLIYGGVSLSAAFYKSGAILAFVLASVILLISLHQVAQF